jgi:hypothetical protein
MVALKYHAYEADELGGVAMLFNQVYDSLNLGYYFTLLVWDDLDGRPGRVIWEDEEDHTPAYSGSYPGFTRYNFSRPVPVDGTFYVGWRQYNEYLLNVGLDLNNRPSSVMFYNFQGQWESSEAPGVIMCRPFLYREPTHIGNPDEEASILHIYPNPTRDRIHVIWPGPMNSDEVRLELFDASGRTVALFRTRSDSYDLSSLQPGIYFIRALAGQTIYRSKVMINP